MQVPYEIVVLVLMQITHVDGTTETHSMAAVPSLPKCLPHFYFLCHLRQCQSCPIAAASHKSGRNRDFCSVAGLGAVVSIYLNGLGDVGSNLQMGQSVPGRRSAHPKLQP